MYAVTATVTHRQKNGSLTAQVPTFYLHPDVQGITSIEHAEIIARSIINPMNVPEITVHVSAAVVDSPSPYDDPEIVAAETEFERRNLHER